MNEDTFDNAAPIEPVDVGADAAAIGAAPSDPSTDTFDSDTVILPDSMQEKTAEEKTKEGMTNDQTKKLDEEDEKDSQKEEKKAEEPEKEEKKLESDEKELEEAEKPKGKTLRGKVDGEAVDINPDMTFKVKVKGKGEIVTAQELINNYSGTRAFDQEFTKLGQDKKDLEQELGTYRAERGQVEDLLNSVMSKIDDPEGNPLDALNLLLEKTGRNVYTFNKRVMDTLREDLGALDGMDEVEQELHWKNKEVDYLKRHQESELSQRNDAEAQKGRIAEVDKIRDAQGVSEEQYVSAHRELSTLGYKDLTPQQVVDYTVVKPFVERAEELVSPYTEDIDDRDVNGFVSTVAEFLRGYPEASEEQAITLAAKRLGYEISTESDVLDQLKGKLDSSEDKAKRDPAKGHYSYGSSQNTEKPESFDDYEGYGYQDS